MNLSDRIRRAREHAGISQGVVAKAAGVKQQAVSKWESGISEPTIFNLSVVVNLCNVRYSWLIDGNGRMQQYCDRTQDVRDGFDKLPESHKNTTKAFIHTMAQSIESEDCDKEANSGNR